MPTMISLRNISDNLRTWSLFEYIAVAFMALIPVWYRSFNLFGLLLVLIASREAAKKWHTLPRLPREMRWLCYLLCANLILASIHFAVGHDSFEVVKDQLKLISIAPLILAIPLLGMRSEKLFLGLCLGMLAAAAIVTYQYHILDVKRPGTAYNPNPFSEIAMVSCGLLSCFSMIYNGWKRALALVCVLAAFYCVLMSGTRGSLIAAIPMVFIAVLILTRFHRLDHFYTGLAQHKYLLLVGFVVVITSLSLGYKYSGMSDRFSKSVKNITTYMHDRSKFSSIGVRFELWYGALLGASEAPLMGKGGINKNSYLKELESAGIIHLRSRTWRHIHSDYFDSLLRRGIPGLMFVISLYGLLFSIFWRNLTPSDPEQFVIAMGGVMTITGYSIFSITEVPLRNSETLVFFVVVIGLLLGMSRTNSKQLTSELNP